MTPHRMAALHAATFTTPRPWSEAEFTALLARPGTVLSVANQGFALAQVTLDEAELLTIAVAPEAQGQGIGRRLLCEIEAEAAARGAETMFLEVAENNHAAIALYRSAGYRDTGRRPRYYTAPDGRRLDALVMARSLGSM